MIALLPSRILPDFEGLVSFPSLVPGFPLHLAWHRRRAKDAALQHVAGILGALLR
jgi:DNA-binding transcriptional LysR family regulator